MTKIDKTIHTQCVNRFVDLANAMKDEGIETQVVSHALMSASGIYTTYAIGGNEVGLTASGVEKVSDAFKRELERIQQSKRQDSQN
jgi:hypothetical protein